MGARYTTRERVADALDIAVTALRAEQIDAAIEAASRSIDDDFRRRFTPELATKYLTWPPRDGGNPSYILRLEYNEAITVTAVTANGTAVTGWTLEPNDTGPPYTRIEMPADGAGFTYGSTPQRNIAVTGLFGYTDEQTPLGSLTAELADTDTTLNTPSSLDFAAQIGVGTTLIIETERITVTGKAFAASPETITGNLTASAAETTVPVSSAFGIRPRSMIEVDGERMKVASVSGSNLIVKRAVDGSVLAAHASGTTFHVPRALTLARGAHGTTAATHATSTAVTKWVPPGAIERLCTAAAIDGYEQERTGHAETAGTGETQTSDRGRGLPGLWTDTARHYSRVKTRTRSI